MGKRPAVSNRKKDVCGGRAKASDHVLSFKCTPEKFAELTERDGIVPAPYVARYHWVALESFGVLKEAELKALLRNSYEMVLANLLKNSGSS